MRINNNIPALKTSSNLNRNSKAMQASLERLSSGYRINKAADDAAGMAISRKMKTQIAGLERASRNAADGVSIIHTAEGAISEVQGILVRMRELAVQSANDTNTTEDRLSIQNEINQLNSEIQRISDTTEFNTKLLLNGGLDRKSYCSNSGVEILTLTDEVEAKKYSFTVNSAPLKAEYSATSPVFSGTTFSEGKLSINGVDVEITNKDTHQSAFAKLRNACELANIDVYSVDGSNQETLFGPGSFLRFKSKEYGSSESIKISCNSNLANDLGIASLINKQGSDASLLLGSEFNSTASVAVNGNYATISDVSGIKITMKIDPSVLGVVEMNILDAGSMKLQIGGSEHQTMYISIPRLDPETIGIDKVNFNTFAGAAEAIKKVDRAITLVTSVRAKLGAYQNRLEHAIANLDVASENMTEALSRIEDTDMAKEMTRQTQLNILTQAGTSMLAQANERPQTILTLLQG